MIHENGSPTVKDKTSERFMGRGRHVVLSHPRLGVVRLLAQQPHAEPTRLGRRFNHGAQFGLEHLGQQQGGVLHEDGKIGARDGSAAECEHRFLALQWIARSGHASGRHLRLWLGFGQFSSRW